MDPDLRVALDLADMADVMAMRRFGGRLHVQRKPDGSMVTDVDRDVETALREHLERVRPGDAVLGEEFGGPASGERRWILDPLDGTGRYVRGARDWGTIVALVRDGDVAVGVMTQPSRGRRWWAARGEGAWSSDGRRLQVSNAPALSSALLCDDHRGNASRGGRHHPGARLVGHCGDCRSPRGMPNALVVAEGGADLAVRIASPWDLAAGKVIVEEAGGAFTDIHGRPRFDTGSALVSNGLVHDEALRALRST
jgi:histidinol-phosphatase